jgi:hypothetical protein
MAIRDYGRETGLNMELSRAPNFMIRQNTCPKCGMYIWAHPIHDCQLSVAQAQDLYDKQVIANREYVARQV